MNHSNEASHVSGKRNEVLNGVGDEAGIRQIENHIHDLHVLITKEAPDFDAISSNDGVYGGTIYTNADEAAQACEAAINTIEAALSDLPRPEEAMKHTEELRAFRNELYGAKDSLSMVKQHLGDVKLAADRLKNNPTQRRYHTEITEAFSEVQRNWEQCPLGGTV